MNSTESSGEITCVCQTDVTCAVNQGDPAPHKALQWEVIDHEGNVIQQPVGRTFSFGSRIEYFCDDGYVLNGDDVRKCTADGWSGRRTTCEEAPIAGLTNFHIAIIASAASGFVIILVAIALVVCCCRDHKKKKRKRKQDQQRRMRAARDNDGFVMNLALAGNDDFLYGNSVARRGRNHGFVGRHNDIRKYQSRPHVLPSSPAPNHSPIKATPTRQARPHSSVPQYNVEIRPSGNRTFHPSEHRLSSPPEADGYRVATSPSTSRGIQRTPSAKLIAPPPGYQDPPPSYDTMVRQGYSNFDRKRANRRLV